MKKIIFITLLSVALKASGNLPFYHYNFSSSIPENLEFANFDLPKNLNSLEFIRVLIFPHTLKNDWRHGGPDNPKKFKLYADDFFTIKGSGEKTIRLKNAKISLVNNKILINGSNELKSPLFFQSATAIRVERYGNEDMSHSYVGRFKVSKNSKGLYIVNTVHMKNYLEGVVPSESVPSWPIEALKAQAIAARSYAVFHLVNSKRSKDWDVDDTARYQVYSGVDHRKPSTDRAVKETLGEVATFNEKIIIAFFHAYSGGFTDSGKNIFETNQTPYCLPKKEVFENSDLLDNLKPKNHWIVNWKKSWKKKDLLRKLKRSWHTSKNFRGLRSSRTYSLKETSFNENFESAKNLEFIQGRKKATVNFKKMRLALGWSNFKSYHFNIDSQDQTKVVISGYGWGHHVGLSQWGAFMMSKYHGSDYKDIITHYYSGVQLRKIY